MVVVVSVFKQTLIMMLLWMDVTHTNRRASSGEEPRLVRGQWRVTGGVPGEAPSAGGRTKLLQGRR